MERSQTPILESVTPPGSPNGMSSPRGIKPVPSFMGSPYSLHSIDRSPNMRSPSHFHSPQLKSPYEQRGADDSDFEESTPRLVIQKLVLINYKSYAGRQEIGPFNESFTAVVGPNGSGKSNVIDSLLFVFGFRAKKMRQDKLSGLIHNSEQHPNLTFARVEVHFANVGVPGSEIILAREVRRDGSSFYSLDGTRCSYSEIAKLLEEKGIDLRHKRFLILQGEVESIALMPPKAENDGDDGLLEYLEDIIGTSNYKTRIIEVEEQAEILRQDCGEKQRRVEIVAKDLKKLDSERAEIEKLMLNQNRATLARSSLWQLYAHRANYAIGFLSQDIEKYEKSVLGLTSEMEEKRSLLASLESRAAEETKETSRLKQELKHATTLLKDAQLKQARAKQRQDQLLASLRKAERDLAHAKNEHGLAKIWLDNFSKDDADLRDKLKSITAQETEERKKLEQMQADLHASTKDLHDELESLQIQAEPWREKISSKQQELMSIESELSEAKQKVELVKQREQECLVEADKVIADGHSTQQTTKHLQKQYDKLQNEQQRIELEIQNAINKKETLSLELDQLRSEVSSAQEIRDASQSRNRLESELLRLKIPGLYGRLGSLGSIDEKYDVAVSTAGPELNNFVVDTVETAKRCIEELRKRSIGRAKFMVLNKLQAPKQSANRFPAPRLVDLIKPVDPVFMKAFASVLGDTMVVPTAEEANRVSFGGPVRYRVVTLNGMLINSSGQMSGGGTPYRGLMAKAVSAVSPEELEGLEKRLASMELDFADIRQRLSALQARKQEVSIELPQVQIKLEKERMSLKELENNMKQIRETRRKVQSEVKAVQEAESVATSRCADKRAQATKEKEDLELQSKPIENAIQAIQDKILNAGGLMFREQSTKVADIQKDEIEIKRRIEDGQEKLGQERSRLNKLEAEIARYEKEISTKPDDISTSEVPDVRELEARVEGLSAEIDSHSSSIEEAKHTAETVRGEIEELRAKQVEVENNMEKLQRNQSENVKKYETLKVKLDQLKLHDVSIAANLDISSSNTVERLAPDAPMLDNISEAQENVHTKDELEDPAPELENLELENMLPELSPDELEGLDESELKAEIASADSACENMKYSQPDTEVLDRYRNRYGEYIERKTASDEVLENYERANEEVQSLKKRRYQEFMDGFLQISSKLKEMYQLITMGGNAELELVDTMDPFAEGILFSVMPPKKSWRNIANLSGGEKTLSSLALVFALHHYKPTPLYVMDEIDAALDFRNVSIIANYIKERTKNGQFIVISLRNNMFELASRLVGVYKVNNMTRSVTLQTE